MKKQICLWLVFMLLIVPSAQAVTLDDINTTWTSGVHTDGINNDPHDQAQMLKELGLFQGTETGFELERNMTRAEAAVMLVRFLGAEQQVLDRTWKHPFTDVPQWADKYIGWLYQSSLTRGISKSKYGPGQNITLGQYAIFLSRALCGNDDWETNGIATADEVELWDETNKFFSRAAAVGLSTRTLSLTYTRNANYTYSMAQYLVDHGVFTTEQLLQAAWGVLPPQYLYLDDKGRLYLRISGVAVGKTEIVDVQGMTAVQSSLPHFYAWAVQDQNVLLYQIDGKTMQSTLVSSRPGTSNSADWGYTYGMTIDGRDYLFEYARDTETINLLAYDGNQLTNALADFKFYEKTLQPNLNRHYFTAQGSMLIAGPEQYYLVKQDGIIEHAYPAGTQPLDFDGKNIVAQILNDATTTITCLSAADAKTVDSYSVAQDMPGDYDLRTIEARGYGRYYGEAGLYMLDSERGRLEQLTARPTSDITFFRMDDRCIILTHNLGQRIRGSYGNGGDQIVLINYDGTEHVLLNNDPLHGIAIVGFNKSITSGGSVAFYSAEDIGMQNFNIYYYILQPSFDAVLGNYDEGQPAIIVTGYSAGRPEVEVEGYEQLYVQQEQARIDSLGYGSKS